MDESSMEALMARAPKGDGRAYAQALSRAAQMLRPYLARRVQACAIDDVLQDILVSVHKSRHTYDGKRPFAPWLFAIARYRVADWLRGAYRDRLRYAEDIAEHAEKLAEPVTESVVASEYIAKAIGQLPEKQARILMLMHGEGYTAKEAAGQMGMTEVAVKVSAHRAYKKLKKVLSHGH